MQNVTRTRPKRSLVRRLVVPVAALSLLGGGGWGAYQYYSHVNSDVAASEAETDINPVAHSASASQAELDLLFSSDERESTPPVAAKPAEKTNPFTSMSNSAKTDRYAMTKVDPATSPLEPPQLPPLVEDEPQTTATKPSTSATPASLSTAVGDRYAKAMTTISTPASSEPAEPAEPQPAKPSAESESEVARGQEPGATSLQIANPPASPPDLDARAAFGQALAQAPQRPAAQPPVKQPTANTSGNLAAALQQARPLQPAPPAGLTNNRYQSAPPTTTTPPATPPAQLQRPAPPLDIQTPPLSQAAPTQRRAPVPTPAAPTLAAPTPAANPFAALPTGPPTGGLASRTPAAAPAPVDRGGLMAQGLTPTPGIDNHPGTGRPGESLLEGSQSPSITIQKLSPEEIQVGKRCMFAIRVHNTGQRTAQNVRIHDEIPLGTELIGTAPRADISGSEVMWDLGTLSPGEQRTVEMELLPKEEGELGSVATVSFAAQASAKSLCTRPELALRLTSKAQVHVGQQHVVQIELTNPGSGDATGVMLLETVPAGVSHEAGPALEFEVGTLQAGETRRMDLVLTAEQAGRVSNVMVARADASLQEEAVCEFEVIAPELQLSIEGPQRRFLERPATYKVSIDNPGTAAAKDVQLVTHLPKGMQFVSANNMGEYDSSTHSVHWSLAELPANERGTVELVALPIEAGAQTLEVATKARQGLEDATDKQVLVEGLSALMFEVEDVEGLIEIGGETTYEIRVRNQGSKAATNVQVAALMPAGIRPLSGQGETRHQIEGPRVVFTPLAQLAPKSDTTFRIQAQGVRPGDQRVRVQVTSDDLQQPITKEVSTKVYADE